MNVVILGAGIIGTSTAWYLSQAGHQVRVIDRQPGPAHETSFANGAQISVSYSEPWANPSAPFKLLKWLSQPDSPLLFRLRPEMQQWLWGLAFLRECLPSRLPRNIKAMVTLSEYSRTQLQKLRQEFAASAIDYDLQELGILNFYVSQADFEGSRKAANYMQQYGVNRRILSAAQVLETEPALRHVANELIGGDYCREDESGDIFKFTNGLAAKCVQAGVQFDYNTQITRLIANQGKVTSAEIIDHNGYYQSIQADAFVVALGSYSVQLLQPLGVPCMVYPTKGYSATFKILKPDEAPVVSLTDNKAKIVYSRLGDRIRVAGTAEMSGYTRDLNEIRCNMLTHRTREVFPGVCDYDNPHYWSGLRPSTPSNVPIIGRTKLANLYMNTGHGTLGWTMGVGSGKVLADIMSQRKPDIDFPFLAA